MNWVGGLRDQVRRRNELQCKQKEYFERKRIENNKRRKTKYNKKGISRDLLNLACIARTVRNPFDDSDEDSDTQSFQTQLIQDKSLKAKESRSKRPKVDVISANCIGAQATDAIHDEDIFFRSNKHQLKLQPPLVKKHSPVYHSTPLLYERFTVHNKILPSNLEQVAHFIEKQRNCSYPYRQHKSMTQVPSRNLPSPIRARNSFQHSSIHPLSILTDEELLLEQTSPFVESDSGHVEPLLQSNSFTNEIATEVNPHSFGDFLHGVPSRSFLVKEERNSPDHIPLLKDEEQFEQYDLINSCLGCENSPTTSDQRALVLSSQKSGQMDFPAEFHQSILDNQVPEIGASAFMGDERTEQPSYHTGPSIDECLIEDENIYLPGTTISSAQSMGSLCSKYSSSDSATTLCPPPSKATLAKQKGNEDIPFNVFNQVDAVSFGQNQFVDATQQTDSNLHRLCVDASTSPIVWSNVDVLVQTEDEH